MKQISAAVEREPRGVLGKLQSEERLLGALPQPPPGAPSFSKAGMGSRDVQFKELPGVPDVGGPGCCARFDGTHAAQGRLFLQLQPGVKEGGLPLPDPASKDLSFFFCPKELPLLGSRVVRMKYRV